MIIHCLKHSAGMTPEIRTPTYTCTVNTPKSNQVILIHVHVHVHVRVHAFMHNSFGKSKHTNSSTCTLYTCHILLVLTSLFNYLQGPPTKSASMENFIRGTTGSSTAGEMDSKELNGHTFSGSSGLNCTPKSGSASSFDEKERGYERSEGMVGEGREGEYESAPTGNIVPIPQLRALMDEERARQ